jgi:hypothetical protein
MEEAMAKALDGRHAVPLEEVVLAPASRFEALLNVLERQGVLEKAEVLEKIKRLQANAEDSSEAPRAPRMAPTLVKERRSHGGGCRRFQMRHP